MPARSEINFTNTYMLARHGEMDFNAQGIWPGQKDIPLNDNGRLQAERLTMPVSPDIIICSPLSRTLETARIIARNIAYERFIIIDERLIEKHGGICEGKKISDIQRDFSSIWKLWENPDLDTILKESSFTGGESDLKVAERLESLIRELEDKSKGITFLLVTHGGVMRMMRYLVGFSKEEIYPGKNIDNCSVEIYKRTV